MFLLLSFLTHANSLLPIHLDFYKTNTVRKSSKTAEKENWRAKGRLNYVDTNAYPIISIIFHTLSATFTAFTERVLDSNWYSSSFK